MTVTTNMLNEELALRSRYKKMQQRGLLERMFNLSQPQRMGANDPNLSTHQKFAQIVTGKPEDYIHPDFWSGFGKEATLGLAGLPGDIGFLVGGIAAPAAMEMRENFREGRPLTQGLLQHVGDPTDYHYTSDRIAKSLGIPFKNTPEEIRGRVFGGGADITALAGPGPRALAATAGEIPLTVGSPSSQAGRIGSRKTSPFLKNFARRKDGTYIGAPKGTRRPNQVQKLIDAYADRVREALKAEVPRGYFYKEGAESLRGLTSTDEEAAKLARTIGATSSEAPVASNFGWGTKAVEQADLRQRIDTGLYPNQVRGKLENILVGPDDVNIGKDKSQLYAMGLSPGRDSVTLAPNDRWEIRSIFGEGTTAPTDAQHRFMHRIREGAVRKLADEGIELSTLEAQELNWAMIKAIIENKTPRQAAGENIQNAINERLFQHTWETDPGGVRGHFENLPVEKKGQYHDVVGGAMIDQDTGRDVLIDAMGGTLQRPAVGGPGVYAGGVNPGTTSQSVVFQTKGKGIDPLSAARVESTEAIRALMLGQEAYAGNLVVPFAPNVKPTKADAISVIGRRLDNDSARQIDALVQKHFPNQGEWPDYAITNTEDGFSILSINPDRNKEFVGQFDEKIAPEIKQILGDDARVALGKQRKLPGDRGLYGELPWDKGKATETVLQTVKDTEVPGLLARADSPETREIAGNVANAYRAVQEAGLGIPNERLMNMLDTWRTEGLAGVEKLVKQGLAPAVLLSILSTYEDETPSQRGLL